MSCLVLHRLRNNTNRTLYLRDMLSPHYWAKSIRLDPYDTIDNFPATRYWEHVSYGGCLPLIVILVDKDQAFGGLSYKHFLVYFELIFEIDEGSNTLIVSGIPARWVDYFPFRLRNIVMISGFKAVKAKNKGRLLSGQEMMTIHVMINYDGERKKNEEGGYIWSSGAHAKWEAILVDKNNLTTDAVANQICTTLGLNGLKTKLMFCHLPESYIPHPRYIQDSSTLKIYLTFYHECFNAIPQVHVIETV